MRRGPIADGWAGSLFPEPIDQVKAPSDRCVCHQDCPQYETCETEALDKNSKVYYLLRCVKGKFPACVNCMCMACDRYHECEDGPERGQPGGTRYRMCHRPISITGCPDYSGSIPWMSEAACKECDHICDLRKELFWAPRVRCDLNPVEPTKKPSEEPSPVQLDGKPTVEHPTLVRYGHETWGQYELEGRLVEEFISTDKPVRKESEFAADMVAVDAARKAAGDLPLARSFMEKGARGIRVYEDPALQEGGTLCCHLVVSKQNGGLCTGCSDRHGTPCSYSRPAEHTSPEPAVAPAKPAKAKKPATPALHRGDRVKFRDDLAPGGVGFGYVTGISHGGPRDLSIHVTWAEYGKKAAMVKDRSCQLMSPDQLELDPLDKWQLANCGKHHTCRDDCAGRKGGLCPFTVSREGGIPADLLEDRAKDDAEAKAAKKPAKAKKPKPEPKPAKVKKSRCPDISTDCPERKECALNKFWKWRPCALQGVEVPTKEPIAVLLDGKWYSDGKEIWDCSDCLCLACANEGKSCHDCKGFERCMKIGGTGGTIGACPDFRTEEGKEQHCLENGCLCFKCQLIGTDCEQCVGPIRCDKPRMKCKDYVGAEVGEVAT